MTRRWSKSRISTQFSLSQSPLIYPSRSRTSWSSVGLHSTSSQQRRTLLCSNTKYQAFQRRNPTTISSSTCRSSSRLSTRAVKTFRSQLQMMYVASHSKFRKMMLMRETGPSYFRRLSFLDSTSLKHQIHGQLRRLANSTSCARHSMRKAQ